jgi:hypothetical protein
MVRLLVLTVQPPRCNKIQQGPHGLQKDQVGEQDGEEQRSAAFALRDRAEVLHEYGAGFGVIEIGRCFEG